MQRKSAEPGPVRPEAGELVWTPDSPSSRIVKWQLLQLGQAHAERILSWPELGGDPVLRAANPKGQVPCWICGESVVSDSLLIIASRFAPQGWLESADALRFRCADVELNLALQALYAARSESRPEPRSLLVELARTAFERAQPGLQSLVYGEENLASQDAMPGWIALHVFGGFLAAYVDRGGHDGLLRGYLAALAAALAPLEALPSFIALERSLAPHAPRIPARWCIPPLSL